jgi:eukaryotic-like serine/threonine-protein kinase
MVSTSELFAGQFRLGSLLGQGGMSDVFRAVDEHTGDAVAVKIVRSGDPELARRLSQEVKVHQRLEHPGLVRLLGTGVAEGQAYIVMELVEGATLAVSLRGGPLGARLTAKLGGILGAALAHVHAAGVVHRDVKPSNIMLGADGRALLGDFGIARLLDATTFTIDGTTVGTVAYMAPEQLEDHMVGASADIWSLGMVLLECLTGRRVYEGTSSEIIARRLAGPVPLPPDLPVPWKLLLSGMLDHRPEQRLRGEQVAELLAASTFAVPWTPSPESVTERVAATAPLDLTALAPGRQFAAALSPDATMVAPPAPPRPSPARHGRVGRGGRGRLVAAGAVVLALLGAGLGYALSSNPGPGSPNGHGNAPVHHGATTSTTSTTTSTAASAPSSPPAALAALVGAVASGVDNGSINPGIGQTLTTQAQQAVSDEAAGQPQQAANDLQQAATTIATSVQNGGIEASEGPVLQGDLTTLAGTLGLSAAATPPTTTTTITPPTVPGVGPGHHHKGGGGGGPGGQ